MCHGAQAELRGQLEIVVFPLYHVHSGDSILVKSGLTASTFICWVISLPSKDKIFRKTEVMVPLYLECKNVHFFPFLLSFVFQHWGWIPGSPTQEVMLSPMFAAEWLRISWDLWTVTWKGASYVPQGVTPKYHITEKHSCSFWVLLSTGPEGPLLSTPAHVSHGFAITKPWVATFSS